MTLRLLSSPFLPGLGGFYTIHEVPVFVDSRHTALLRLLPVQLQQFHSRAHIVPLFAVLSRIP